MRQLKLLILFVFMIQSCSFIIDEPKLGEYRAEIKTKDGSILPFKFILFNESGKGSLRAMKTAKKQKLEAEKLRNKTLDLSVDNLFNVDWEDYR